MKPITPCFWFNKNGLEAVKFYVSIFKNSKITKIVNYPKSNFPPHRGMEGKPLLIEFTLGGRRFSALNAGPEFRPTEALSLQIWCKTQKEADHYWNKLSKGGDKKAQICGWLKDKYGYSWQIGPQDIGKWLSAKDPVRRARVFAAIQGKKLDFKKLKAAYKEIAAAPAEILHPRGRVKR